MLNHADRRVGVAGGEGSLQASFGEGTARVKTHHTVEGWKKIAAAFHIRIFMRDHSRSQEMLPVTAILSPGRDGQYVRKYVASSLP